MRDKSNLLIKDCRWSNDFPSLASFCFCSKYVLSSKYPADVYLLSWWRDWLPNVLLCLLARALGVRSPSPSLFFFSQACHPFSFRLPRCVEPPLNKTYFFWWLLFCSYAPYDFSFTCMSFSISFNDCTSGTPEIPFAPKQTEIPPSMLIFPKTQSHHKMVSKETVFKD